MPQKLYHLADTYMHIFLNKTTFQTGTSLHVCCHFAYIKKSNYPFFLPQILKYRVIWRYIWVIHIYICSLCEDNTGSELVRHEASYSNDLSMRYSSLCWIVFPTTHQQKWTCYKSQHSSKNPPTEAKLKS